MAGQAAVKAAAAAAVHERTAILETSLSASGFVCGAELVDNRAFAVGTIELCVCDRSRGRHAGTKTHRHKISFGRL